MDNSAALEREPVDIIVHIPLEAEYLEFREVFEIREEFQHDYNVIVRVKAPSGLSIVAIVQEKMGRTSAATACNTALRLFNPRLYVCLGIAGGLSKDLSLGDVCYTGTLFDVYDNSKITDAEGGGMQLALAPEPFATDRRLTAALGFVRTLMSLSDLHQFWKEDQERFARQQAPEPIEGRPGVFEQLGAPSCKNGDIVCGAVSASEAYRDLLKGITRNILAIETESGPIFDACREHGLHAITIRGISDYANASKGALEGATKDAVRRVAARNAASFLHMQLQSPVFLQAIHSVTGAGHAQQTLDLEQAHVDPLPGWLNTLADEIDSKLRELSPQFRTKPTGYKLPTPRVKIDLGSAVIDPKSKPAAEEFLSAIASHRKLLLYVPRNYPDQALPWVLASALLQADVAGKKAIPIVIDGKKIGPPKSDFESLSSISLVEDIDKRGGEYIFLVTDPPISSKTRTDYILKQIKKWSGSRVVFITRSNKSFLESTGFSRKLSLNAFTLCDVSFSEMAAFIESAFEMPSHEAEVVALKLKGMFSRFSLPAHPSFFAGIPPEALASLLAANRRSELIQLAVDGFLSFVVASDRDPVRMSRTNRARFLRRLVIEILHEKRALTEADVVSLAKSISDEYDYGLDPISFINAFSNAGLIHFPDGKAEITLPFIESYLFADEMHNNNDLANSFFSLPDEELNLSIADLYFEIGPSESTIEKIIGDLETALASFGALEGEHILLGGAISPRALQSGARFNGLSRRIADARAAVSSGAGNRHEKARILDVVDRVNEEIADQEASETEDQKHEETEVHQRISSLLRAWTLATILLGAGAESIEGVRRQAIAELVIRGGEYLLEAMITHYASTDFEAIKTQIVSDKTLRGTLKIEDDDEHAAVISALVDLLEYMLLSQPLERVFDQLPEIARHRIVGNSVAKAQAITPIQKLIKFNWLTTINVSDGRADLLQTVGTLPHARFLRATLTSMFIMRVKWKIADHDTRMALLDAAEVCIRPFNPTMDKGEIMRFVERHTREADDGAGEEGE